MALNIYCNFAFITWGEIQNSRIKDVAVDVAILFSIFDGKVIPWHWVCSNAGKVETQPWDSDGVDQAHAGALPSVPAPKVRFCGKISHGVFMINSSPKLHG